MASVASSVRCSQVRWPPHRRPSIAVFGGEQSRLVQVVFQRWLAFLYLPAFLVADKQLGALAGIWTELESDA